MILHLRSQNFDNMEKENDYGLIYVLTNKYMPGLVKIGVTRRLDIQERMRELNGTSVPYPFDCAFSCKVPGNMLFEIEKAVHLAFDDNRVSPSREFFKVTPEVVIPLLKVIARLSPADDVTEFVQEVINVEEEKRTRRKNMDFSELGLQKGDVLIYTRDNNITCTITSNKTVNYGDQHGVSLSSITKELLGYAVQPSPFWQTKDGIKLIDLQNGKQKE